MCGVGDHIWILKKKCMEFNKKLRACIYQGSIKSTERERGDYRYKFWKGLVAFKNWSGYPS